LLIALDNNYHARGDLFWDDGESIDTYERNHYNYFIFSYDNQRLIIEPWTYKYPTTLRLNEIKIYRKTVK